MNQEQVLEFCENSKIVNGILVAPTLYSMNANNRYLRWKIFIGIERDDEMVAVEPSHYEDKLDLEDDEYGVYWTESGLIDGVITRSAKTIIYQGKNIGKANYTTPFTQAVLTARSIFNKKIRKGHVLNKKNLKKKGSSLSFEELATAKDRGEYPWRVFAMALHDYKKFSSKIHFPATVQDKRDGTLFIVVQSPFLLEHGLANGIDGYSRGRDAYEGQTHIFDEILPYVEKFPGLHFCGELWKSGYGLQDVSGSVRRKTTRGDTVKLDFNIFDCFYLDQPKLGFVERQTILKTAIPDNLEYVKLIPYFGVENEDELMKIYNECIEKGFEGVVIRNIDAPYEFGINKEIRSYSSLKLKPRNDAEWPIVNFTEGRGKEVGAVIWICSEKEKTFNVTPNLDYDTRYRIFTKLSEDSGFFEQKIKGELVTISYSILSTDGLPQQPKVLHFKNIKIDELLLE